MGEDPCDRVGRSLFAPRTAAGVAGRASPAQPPIAGLDSVVVIGELQ